MHRSLDKRIGGNIETPPYDQFTRGRWSMDLSDPKTIELLRAALAVAEGQQRTARATIADLWSAWEPAAEKRPDARVCRTHKRLVLDVRFILGDAETSLGELPWARCDLHAIDAWTAAMLARKATRGPNPGATLTNGYVNRVRNTLQSMLTWHRDRGDIDRNPMAGCERLSETDGEREGWFSPEQFERFIEHVPLLGRDMLRLAFYCGGMRSGEVRNLRKQDVDWDVDDRAPQGYFGSCETVLDGVALYLPASKGSPAAKAAGSDLPRTSGDRLANGLTGAASGPSGAGKNGSTMQNGGTRRGSPQGDGALSGHSDVGATRQGSAIEAARERFWSKVDRSGGPGGCWPWTAARNRRGYGVYSNGPARLGNRGETVGAHRVACLLGNGAAPAGKRLAIHSCDNPPCCNPAHLRWGSHQDNTNDAIERGRLPRRDGKLIGPRRAYKPRVTDDPFIPVSAEEKAALRAEGRAFLARRRETQAVRP